MPQSPQASFAANVRRIRERRELTQEQLGWAAGIHQTAIARIENGERKPTLDTIIKLARGLEVPPAELFTGID
jgi:transcriptional regulator with XRE-family HTH domain